VRSVEIGKRLVTSWSQVAERFERIISGEVTT
jgi:hypothetical protein